MRLILLRELTEFLTLLEETQQELLVLFGSKRQALDQHRSDELVRLSAQEGVLAARLQELVKERSKFLLKARGAGFAVESLLEFAGAVGKTVGDSRVLRAIELIEQRIYEAQQRTARLQHESWVHWIVSHRCYNHYTELLELIAHGGQRAPTYGDRQPSARGGALLDAAV